MNEFFHRLEDRAEVFFDRLDRHHTLVALAVTGLCVFSLLLALGLAAFSVLEKVGIF